VFVRVIRERRYETSTSTHHLIIYGTGKALPPSMSRMSENVGASTSRNPKGLHGLHRDNRMGLEKKSGESRGH
jgi:hypothetical protein